MTKAARVFLEVSSNKEQRKALDGFGLLQIGFSQSLVKHSGDALQATPLAPIGSLKH